MRLNQHLGACMTFVVASPVVAQRPDSLTGQLAHTFREVTAIHELRDGRALVLDSHDRYLYLADFHAGTVQPVASQGWEDRQYLWPSRLLTIPGDTILLWDAIAGRLHALTETNGSYAVRVSLPQSSLRVRSGPTFVPVVSDTLGRLYRQEQHGGRIIVTRLGTSRSIVDTVLNMPTTRDVSSQLFPSYSRWAVDASGRVAHVLVNPYRVDLYPPNGPAATGANIAFTPTTVTPAVQKAWLEVMHRPRIVWASQRGGRPGFIEVSDPPAVYGSWPLVIPPVVDRCFIGFASDGTLIIERLALPGMPSEYDVIGTRGELIDRFELAPNTQIVASGSRAVYVTTRGADGRLTLQRFSVRSR